jgi:serine/threonine protein kinase/tetratricopeptide (TPR) repeat protein
VPESGELIGPYRLVSQLGKGAMGEVWRARDERLDRYVALKILPPDASGDLERRARMVREAKAAAQIKHANVVTLFDVVEHRGEDILVMELVEGRTLSEALRKDGPPQLEVALRWIEGIADALVAAHERRILHRDIKAANIMVAGNDVKVLDFGLAKLRDEHLHTLPPRKPAVIDDKIALDATMASQPGRSDPSLAQTLTSSITDGAPKEQGFDIDSYRTHAGQLLGTPLYMAPEQIEGREPDERSEVFSLGVLSHEILAGKPPYTAASMDELFRQISKDEAPELPELPDAIQNIVFRALAKQPAERYPTMAAFRDAIRTERRRRFAPKSKKWPLVLAAVAAVGAIAVAIVLWRANPATPEARPGDDLVKRALDEYDVFYNDKALSSLRTALARVPEHPTANAYILLFGGSDSDRARALQAAPKARDHTDEGSRDRALLDAAVAFSERGPLAARNVLTPAVIGDDRELAFWAAELDYRAGNYKPSRDAYAALLAQPQQAFRGRIYDHYSSVLLYLDEPDEALRIGTLYRDAFPGEADAVAVYATTLAAVGDYTKAVEAAENAVALSEGEDTLAGLAKVLALSGDRVRAKAYYRQSLDKAGPSRRPVRRAALALLQYMDGDLEGAKATVAPCLVRSKQADPAGNDGTARERGTCLFVAGLVDPSSATAIADALDALAAQATELRPAYGAPASLAKLLRARSTFFGGGCIVDPEPSITSNPRADRGALDPAIYDVWLDFYAAYHIPFFATYAACEKAAVLATKGDRSGARKLLTEIAERGKNRTWLLAAAKRYE